MADTNRKLVSDAPPLAVAARLKTHVPTLVGILANRLRRASSSYYREKYGIGMVEWRVMMVLEQRAGICANEVSRLTDLDKAAVSRALRALMRQALVQVAREGTRTRSAPITLTDAGAILRRELVADARERERLLVAEMDEADLAAFVAALRALIARVPVWAGQGDHHR